tara:strand:+ start:276 stop:704 length:429 start_codon:yes stop_codon:yes gene_type:complete
MSYVLESDFIQTNTSQWNQIARNISDIDLHSRQLVEMGIKQDKIGDDLTKFGNIELPALQATDQNQWENIQFNINRLNELQDQINTGKIHRDAIEAKLDNRPPPNECAFWDIPCKMKETTSQIGLLAVLAGAGFIGYKVLTR